MRYYLNHNPQLNDDHEVHTGSCSYIDASRPNYEYLGSFDHCSTAVSVARGMHPFWRINGCRWCSESCHTS